MPQRTPEEERDYRIEMEIIVDAYDEEEQALGWHTYLDEHLNFPFKARCKVRRANSPLLPGETVTVTRMGQEYDCMNEMLVKIKWKSRTFSVPLAQLEGINVDEETQQAIEDWHYWFGKHNIGGDEDDEDDEL